MKKAKIILNADTIIVLERSKIHIFKLKDVIGIFCDHPYLTIETVNENPILIFHSLKEIGQLLSWPFIVCNQSAIVIITHIRKMLPEKATCLLYLENGRKVRVARRLKRDVMKEINRILREK
jgi:DNA-binding LytR/AlgR family response regulator